MSGLIDRMTAKFINKSPSKEKLDPMDNQVAYNNQPQVNSIFHASKKQQQQQQQHQLQQQQPHQQPQPYNNVSLSNTAHQAANDYSVDTGNNNSTQQHKIPHSVSLQNQMKHAVISSQPSTAASSPIRDKFPTSISSSNSSSIGSSISKSYTSQGPNNHRASSLSNVLPLANTNGAIQSGSTNSSINFDQKLSTKTSTSSLSSHKSKDKDDSSSIKSSKSTSRSRHKAEKDRRSVGSLQIVKEQSSPVVNPARVTKGRYKLTDFNLQRTLGTGSFGRVHLVKSQHNARFYAVKVLNKDQVLKMKQVEHTISEREMLSRVRHPFLVNLWGTFQDSINLYMVMDFVAGGELFSLLRKSQRFPSPVAKFYAAEVALALEYMHSMDIIYRDLKPENILIGADGHIKVTDLGFAKFCPDVTWTLCGTPDYLAPEIVASKGYNKSVDWYALGVLIFEMLAGYPPFFTEDPNPMRLYEKIMAGKVRYPNFFDPTVKDLLQHLITGDLSMRFGNLINGSRDIFGHKFFAEVVWDRLLSRNVPAPYIPRIDGEGDSSQFDNYKENDTSAYGATGPDPYGHLFTEF